MSHTIDYRVFDKGTTEREILKWLNTFAFDPQETGGYHSNLTFHKEVYDNIEEAEKAIKKYDKGWYSDHAVLFRDCAGVKETPKMKELNLKIKEVYDKRSDFIKKNSIKNRTSKYIGCSECGSKLSVEHLRGEYCPLCRNDLRSKTVLERIKGYDSKMSELEAKYLELEHKQKDKAEVKWLVKYEYHC